MRVFDRKSHQHNDVGSGGMYVDPRRGYVSSATPTIWPFRKRSASSPRDDTPSLLKMLATCVVTVRAEMPSAPAISLFDFRSATSRAMSFSRSVSRATRRPPQPELLHHLARVLLLDARAELRARLVALPQLPDAAFDVAHANEDVGVPAPQPRGVVHPRHRLELLDRVAKQLRGLRVVLL